MADSFFRRWSERKSQAQQQEAPVGQTIGATAPLSDATRPDGERPLPSLADVAALTPESDYSAFVARGVDPLVRRQALKKLFAAPGFAPVDGLDIHMEDYNRFAPLPAAMLAALNHAKSVLAPVPLYPVRQAEPEPAQDPVATAADNGGVPASDAAPEPPPQQAEAERDPGVGEDADPERT
jgi:hypothetical protein